MFDFSITFEKKQLSYREPEITNKNKEHVPPIKKITLGI